MDNARRIIKALDDENVKESDYGIIHSVSGPGKRPYLIT